MRRVYFYLSLVFLIVFQSACDSIEIVSPPGPSGKSAYEVWVEAVNNKEISWNLGTDVANYFKYIKGKDGNPGKDAYLIWKEWIKDGSVDNPHKSGEKWSPANDTKRHFYLFLSGAKGEKGLTPFINNKGNWQIGDVDTNIPAQGPKGNKGDTGSQGPKGDKGDTGSQGPKGDKGDKGDTGGQGPKGDKGDTGSQGPKGDKGDTGSQGPKGDKGDTGNQGPKGDKGDTGNQGHTPVIEIKNGTWHIDGVDTGIQAQGPKGDKGDAGGSGGGKSAYEIWKEEVNKGTIKYDITKIWPSDKTELSHFWFYIQGKDPNGNGGSNGGGGTNPPINLEQTKIGVRVHVTSDTPDEYGRYPIGINITTDPGATVYFQIYMVASSGFSDIKTAGVANSSGELSYDDNGNLSTSFGDGVMYNIWAIAPGKLQSPHMHIPISTAIPI